MTVAGRKTTRQIGYHNAEGVAIISGFDGDGIANICRSYFNPALVSPVVAQFPQLHEHRFRVRRVRQVGKVFAQLGDHAGAA